jgi:hypothetical protein
MPILPDYNAFGGRHHETGSIHNALAYQGVKAPHTGQPISEALLLGISGGIAFGYFTFEYTGYQPHIALLTRNTFDPLETMFERLALPRDVIQTASAEKAGANLIDVLEGGRPALVWTDMMSLPYNNMPPDANYWAMMPVVVYGYADGMVHIADRSGQPLTVPADVFQQARARVKKDKFRLMTVDAPDMNRLPGAVSKGIWQCISLFTDAPPKGARHNFGLAALEHWSKLLTGTRNKQSWARYFPPGVRMWMALVGDQVQPGAFTWLWRDGGNHAERGMYADFLNEAAAILDKPGLKDAASLYRQSAAASGELVAHLLPDAVPAFKAAREMLVRKQMLFREQGIPALDAIQAVDERLNALREAAETDFPLSDAEAAAFRERLAEQVNAVRAVEAEAVACLQSVMA